MDELWTRIVENMTGRVSGPMKFRLLLQPTMAAIFAIRAGLADAKTGKPPYSWGLLTDPAHRANMLKDGWKSVGTISSSQSFSTSSTRSSSRASCIRAK